MARNSHPARTRLGTVRAYWLAVIVFMAAFMAGYDSGVAGGVLTFAPFFRDFQYEDTDSKVRQVNSLTVGLQQLGSFLSCFLVFSAADRLGRKTSIQTFSFIFIVGIIIETINTESLAAWYVARIVAGFGQGACSAVVPIYSAEMAPKEIRGRLGSFYQWMFTIGIFTSYWVNYGVVRGVSSTESRQWQLPIGLQLVAGSILFLGMFTLPESVRWLVKKERYQRALDALCWVRADSTAVTVDELEEIKIGIQEEVDATKGVSFGDLLAPINRKGVLLGMAIFLFQQSTGASALAYFSNQFFKTLVGEGDQDILLTALFGAVKVIACTVFILLLVENFGRGTLLTTGSIAMGICMFCTALVDKFQPDPEEFGVTSSGIATIALLFINIAFYNFSWGPLPWAYVPELFPTRTRALGMGVCVAAHWLFSFVFTFSASYMVGSLGWGTFLFYAVFDFVAAAFCYFYMKSTRNKSLERVQAELGGTSDAFFEKIAANVSEETVDRSSHYRDPQYEAPTTPVNRISRFWARSSASQSNL